MIGRPCTECGGTVVDTQYGWSHLDPVSYPHQPQPELTRIEYLKTKLGRRGLLRQPNTPDLDNPLDLDSDPHLDNLLSELNSPY